MLRAQRRPWLRWMAQLLIIPTILSTTPVPDAEEAQVSLR